MREYRITGIEDDVIALKIKDADKDREIASVKAQAQFEKAAKDKEIEKLKQENTAIKERLEKIEKALNSK
ncbi:MAG: hypothetical protein H7328_11490 [Bdellovibrio sp.]|nr:hypothetical protein [Bdellovibrio sp.]